MAVDRRIGFVALILTPLLISGRFLRNESTDQPRKDNPRFQDGDLIPLFANRVYSLANANDKGYTYFDLPFCPPGEPIKNRKKSLTEILSGDCFTNTQYEFRFMVESLDKLLCEKTLTRAEVAKFRDAVKEEFRYEMGFDDGLLWGMVGKVNKTEESRPRPRYYLVTHLRFHLLYKGNQVKRIFVFDDFDSAVDITEDVEIKVKFTYSVFWAELLLNESSDLLQKRRTSMSSLMFWTSVVLFWFGVFLLLILIPFLMAEFCSVEMSAGVVKYWQPIHNENCNCPPFSSLLGAFLGTGIQLLIAAFILFFLAYSRRTLSAGTILMALCLTSVVSGYKAVAFHLRFNRPGWKKIVFLAGALYLVPLFLTVCYTNVVAQIYFEESDILEIGLLLKVLILCGIFTGILSILGGVIAYCLKEKTSEVPCATRRTTSQRAILSRPWYRNTLAQGLIGGLPPFIYISPSMDNIFATLMNRTLCGAFKTMFDSFIVIIAWTLLLAIGFARFIDPSKNDHRWWWRSVLRGGSTAIYMFFYGIYFASKINLEGPLLVVYLEFNLGAFYAFFLILGTISFYVSSINHHNFEKNE